MKKDRKRVMKRAWLAVKKRGISLGEAMSASWKAEEMLILALMVVGGAI